MKKLTELELVSASHARAMTLLKTTLETQPNLIQNAGIHGNGGTGTGMFITALYDQLLVLARKNLEGEYNE